VTLFGFFFLTVYTCFISVPNLSAIPGWQRRNNLSRPGQVCEK
jgi:hypothetical protein